MTWQHFLRTLIVALIGASALALASHARAESNLISPQEAEALVKAQAEEKAAFEAELAAQEAEIAKADDAEKKGKSAKSADKTKSTDKKKTKEAAAATIIAPEAAKPATEAKVVEEKAEETASLPAVQKLAIPRGKADEARSDALKPMIAQYAAEHGIPYELADAVVRLESRYNAGARNGPNLGLTQINFRTAQSLGYKGDAAGLFDAETNLRYGLKYLAQAYKLAGGDTCGTILRYQFGHRTTTMTGASRVYCAKVKVLTAAAE
ncbi:transglycosylase SLT domain-containing protein [Microvirga sp. 2YAF29]|uniref:transglycosylase SLT domain-containing protein n=1 Tax=Microvirga sp. 2YAF29 TaxID=3233031 RepID=UPI003F943B13